MENIEEIIHKAQQGDKSAYEKLYKEYYKKIFRYCKINLYREEIAQDICQETFIKAWKALPNFTLANGGTFQAFLFRIARNLIIDLSRKKKEVSIEQYEELETDQDLVEELDRKDEIEKVKRALAKLNEADRQIIILRYFEDMSHQDAAKIIGIKEGALRVRTVRLLKKLKDILSSPLPMGES